MKTLRRHTSYQRAAWTGQSLSQGHILNDIESGKTVTLVQIKTVTKGSFASIVFRKALRTTLINEYIHGSAVQKYIDFLWPKVDCSCWPSNPSSEVHRANAVIKVSCWWSETLLAPQKSMSNITPSHPISPNSNVPMVCTVWRRARSHSDEEKRFSQAVYANTTHLGKFPSH